MASAVDVRRMGLGVAALLATALLIWFGTGGSLFVSDERGRMLAETRSDAAPFSTLLASVPVHEKTLFLRLGDSLAWLALVILGLCLAQLARPRKAPSPRAAGLQAAA